jgi:hypothetical protein
MPDRVDAVMDAVEQAASTAPAGGARAYAGCAQVRCLDQPVLAGGNLGEPRVG